MSIGVAEGIAIAKILATLGQGYMAKRDADRMRREQEAAQREQDRRVGVANLRNAFGGNAGPSPVNYTPSGPGMGSQLLGALGIAADVAGIWHGATKADDLRKLQMENVQGQIDARTLATDTARGQLLGQAAVLPRTGTIAPAPKPVVSPSQPTGGAINPYTALSEGIVEGALNALGAPPPGPITTPRIAPAKVPLSGSVPPFGLSDIGQAAFKATQNQRIAARNLAGQESAQQQFENLMQLKNFSIDERRLDLNSRKFALELDKLANPQLTPEQKAAIEKGLRGDYLLLTKDFKTIGESFQTIMAGAEDPTAASDLSLIFNFMKMLDPESVVRESEFNTAKGIGSASEAIQNKIFSLWDGEQLRVTRPDFLQQAMEIYNARIPGYESIGRQYSEIAGRQNVDPLNVVLDFTVNTDKAVQLIRDLTGKADPGRGLTVPAPPTMVPAGLRNYGKPLDVNAWRKHLGGNQ